jgi:hypothetical protein
MGGFVMARILTIDDNAVIHKTGADDWFHVSTSGGSASNSTWKKVHEYTIPKDGKYLIITSVTSGGVSFCRTRYNYNRISVNEAGSTPAGYLVNSLDNIGVVNANRNYCSSMTQWAGDFVKDDVVSLWFYASVAGGTIDLVWNYAFQVKPWGGN